MKSIKQQYIDLMEGRMSQHNFMRSLRMTMPQYVTNITSFKDSVRILKNKGILNEAYANEAPSYDYNGKKLYVDNQSGEPDAPGGKVSLYDEEENEYIGVISSIDGEGMIYVDEKSIKPVVGSENRLYEAKDPIEATLKSYLAKGYSYTEAIELTAAEQGMDEEVLISQYPQDAVDTEGYEDEEDDEEFIDMIAKAEEEEAGKYTKFDDFEGGLSEGDDASEALKTVKEPNPNAGKYRITSIDGKMVIAKDFFDSMEAAQEYAKKNIRTSYKIVKLPAERSVYKKIDEAKKKKEPKAEMHPNQIHPQELRMGIKVELEHTDDLDKAKKIALDHLAENPFYYTALKLSGIESPSAPKAKYPVEKKAKKKKEAIEMVDAANQMQKVKMPKVVKENLNEGGEWTITGTLTKDEQTELKNMIGNYELDVQATDDTLETTISHPMYNDKSLEQALKQVRGMLTPSKDKKDLGGSFDKFKSQLESLVREVLDEMYDGRDNLDEDGGFEQWKQALYKIVMEKAKLEADEIAIDDAEIKQYYQKGKTPEEVYFDIWQQDAGNFFSISF